MIQSANIDSISYVLFSVDLLTPIDIFTVISLTKPELGFTKSFIPTITQLDNNITVLEWCMVALVDEDLPNGKVYVSNFGEWTLTIMTSNDNINFSTVWVDLYRMIGNEIQTYGL